MDFVHEYVIGITLCIYICASWTNVTIYCLAFVTFEPYEVLV